MARVIWKYPIKIQDEPTEVRVPYGSKVVHVGMQDTKVCVWIERDVDTKLLPTDLHWAFYVIGTGHAIPIYWVLTHVGSVFDGPFVWHIYQAS